MQGDSSEREQRAEDCIVLLISRDHGQDIADLLREKLGQTSNGARWSQQRLLRVRILLAYFASLVRQGNGSARLPGDTQS